MMFQILRRKLDDKGERVDIDYYHMKYDKFDVYQKSHYRRYEYAQSFLNKTDSCADLACGSGYGSMILSEKCSNVVGVDLNSRVIDIISKKYKKTKNVSFISENLLNLQYQNEFDTIVSFETIEHLEKNDIPCLFSLFAKALKPDGLFIFSTPYNQNNSEAAIEMSFHLTFWIVEETIKNWLDKAGFVFGTFKYQNYQNHEIVDSPDTKDFIICTARKKKN